MIYAIIGAVWFIGAVGTFSTVSMDFTGDGYDFLAEMIFWPLFLSIRVGKALVARLKETWQA
jgi:hypothetical protein